MVVLNIETTMDLEVTKHSHAPSPSPSEQSNYRLDGYHLQTQQTTLTEIQTCNIFSMNCL